MKRITIIVFGAIILLMSFPPKCFCQSTYKDTTLVTLNNYYNSLNAVISNQSTREGTRKEIQYLFCLGPDNVIVQNDLALLKGRKVSKQTSLEEYLNAVQATANEGIQTGKIFKIEFQILNESYTETTEYVEGVNRRGMFSTIDVDKTIKYGESNWLRRDRVFLFNGKIYKIESSSRKPSSSEVRDLPTSKRVEIYATVNGRRINANLYVSPVPPKAGQTSGYQSSFSVDLPYGRYVVNMTSGDASGSETIVVSERGKNSFEVKLKRKKNFTWPWEVDFDHHVSGIAFAFNQEQIKGNVDAENFGYFDDAWSRDDKSFYGGQIGVHFQPCFQWGGGLYTGFFFQYSYSTNNATKTDEGLLDEVYTSCSEKAIMIPLHLYFRIPLSRKIAIVTHGGADVAYYFGKRYFDNRQLFLTLEPEYGSKFSCHHLNYSYSAAVGIQFGRILLEVLFNHGLTNHDKRTFDFNDKSLKSTIENMSYKLSILL